MCIEAELQLMSIFHIHLNRRRVEETIWDQN